MRAVIQRVNQASVLVENALVSKIDKGLLVFIGIGKDDDTTDAEYIANKITGLRIFEDTEGKMNLSIMDIKGEILAVSQFTLYGDCRKGKRPSFTEAMPSEDAKKLYEYVLELLGNYNTPVKSGIYQATMQVHSENFGPVTMMIDSKKNF